MNDPRLRDRLRGVQRVRAGWAEPGNGLRRVKSGMPNRLDQVTDSELLQVTLILRIVVYNF